MMTGPKKVVRNCWKYLLHDDLKTKHYEAKAFQRLRFALWNLQNITCKLQKLNKVHVEYNLALQSRATSRMPPSPGANEGKYLIKKKLPYKF